MVQLSIMIEGQNGLNWPRWKRIVAAVEDLGFAGLFRSDHVTNGSPPDLDSLELWVSLSWLADHTRRIHFGPLVSPVSFRHPVHTARMAAAVDDLSNGRLILGMGAGWNVREHRNFGWELLDLDQRFLRFQEGLDVVTHLLLSDRPVNFQGEYFCLQDAILLPRPQRPGGPPILIGGNGRRRTLPLASKYASAWNAVYPTPSELSSSNKHLDGLLSDIGRKPTEVLRSSMNGCVFASDEARLQKHLAMRRKSAEELRQSGVVVGTPTEFVEQLGALESSGAQEVMLQWLDLDDLAGLEALASTVLPQVSA
ncbi:MAG: TIGR03560 family F420-dependent LLM class oxidoreductase [Chloroflexi bacterium]|nr:TIGR03560 family F420-dependent LLM class oxidoreductase [Chloroflexota bacterium]